MLGKLEGGKTGVEKSHENWKSHIKQRKRVLERR